MYSFSSLFFAVTVRVTSRVTRIMYEKGVDSRQHGLDVDVGEMRCMQQAKD